MLLDQAFGGAIVEADTVQFMNRGSWYLHGVSSIFIGDEKTMMSGEPAIPVDPGCVICWAEL
jgi:hypothetical protein